MELLSTFLTIVVPAGLVLFAMYLAIKSFMDKEARKGMIDLKLKSQEHILPIRLQAYERLCLFLERVSPGNIILRINNPTFTSAHLHQQLLTEIREEFNHNLSQQLYVSNDAWAVTKKAMEDIISVINNASATISPDSKSIELAKAVFERMAQEGIDPALAALNFVKNEARQLF